MHIMMTVRLLVNEPIDANIMRAVDFTSGSVLGLIESIVAMCINKAKVIVIVV